MHGVYTNIGAVFVTETTGYSSAVSGVFLNEGGAVTPGVPTTNSPALMIGV